MKIKQIIKVAAAGAMSVGTLVGCSSNAGTGALAGGAAGAATGAIIGHNSHDHTEGGALIGGALGAIGGAILGSEIDRQQREKVDRDTYYHERQYDAPPPPPPYVYRDYPPGYYEVRRYDPYTGTMYIERHYPY